MADDIEHVVVVGAGLAGYRTVEQLRERGFAGQLTFIGAELHLPYDRPPLSKQFLTGDWESVRIALTQAERLNTLAVTTLTGQRVVALHPGRVELANDWSIEADAVVIATGVHARRLPGQPPNVHTLRSLDDALALREDLEHAKSMLIVGAGFVGSEVASTAATKGIAVTLLETQPVPLTRVLGEDVGQLCGRLLREAGVDLRTSTSVAAFLPREGAGVSVELSDGSQVDADVAVVGIGGQPTVDWLEGTGLDLTNGVKCNETGRVLGLDRVWAVGDVASWIDPTGERHERHEHWTSAAAQAAAVAADITGTPAPPPDAGYFWSDQFGLKIQLIGRTEQGLETVQLHGSGLSGGPVRGTVVGYFDDDRIVAAAGFGAPRDINRYRAAIAGGASRAEVLELAANAAAGSKQ